MLFQHSLAALECADESAARVQRDQSGESAPGDNHSVGGVREFSGDEAV